MLSSMNVYIFQKYMDILNSRYYFIKLKPCVLKFIFIFIFIYIQSVFLAQRCL